MPCPIHGAVEPLTPLNAWYWDMYVDTVAPFAVRDDLTIAGGKLASIRRLDFLALQSIAATYPVGQPRRFIEAMQLIFDTLQEA